MGGLTFPTQVAEIFDELNIGYMLDLSCCSLAWVRNLVTRRLAFKSH